MTAAADPLRPYVATTLGSDGYQVRETRGGVLLGHVWHEGPRVWTADCEHGCRGEVAGGPTRVGAARGLLEHFEADHS